MCIKLKMCLFLAMDESSFIPTRCAQFKKDAPDSFECVHFSDRNRKTKKQNAGNNKLKTDENVNDEVDIKKLKREVVKYGLTGFSAKKKQAAKIEMAVRLGAKPPPNKYLNYKELKVEKQKLTKEREEEQQLLNAGKTAGVANDKGKKFLLLKKRKEMKRNNILESYGKVKVS